MHQLIIADFPNKRRTLLLPQNAAGKELSVAFFDADNTLRETRSGKASPHGRHDVIIHTQAIDRLKELYEQGFLIAVVSNQAGVELKMIDYEEVEDAMQETLRLFSEKGIGFHYYDFADLRDINRKPEVEMAWRLERKLRQTGHSINWQQSFMVGDAAWKKGRDTQPDGSPGTDHANSDRRFAENIALKHPGFGFFHPRDFFKKTASPRNRD